jgi:hypothetical protein
LTQSFFSSPTGIQPKHNSPARICTNQLKQSHKINQTNITKVPANITIVSIPKFTVASTDYIHLVAKVYTKRNHIYKSKLLQPSIVPHALSQP